MGMSSDDTVALDLLDPVLNLQAGHAPELAFVVGDEREV
jgi:hypothetical protein